MQKVVAIEKPFTPISWIKLDKFEAQTDSLGNKKLHVKLLKHQRI